MKEYWVNVYENYIIGDKHINRNSAIVASHITQILYRIHVKMKEPKLKFSGYPTYEDIERTKPKLIKTPRTNWMDN